jgi:excisionase family DNA binding protein
MNDEQTRDNDKTRSVVGVRTDGQDGTRPRRRRASSPGAKSQPAGAVDRWRERLTSVPARPPYPAKGHPARPTVERPRTVAEAAEELGLSVHTVRAWIANRRLAHIRLGRAIRIPADELRRVIDAGTVPAERQ